MNNMYYYPIFDIPIACHYGAFLKRQNDSYLHIMCNLKDTLLISTQHVLCKMSHFFLYTNAYINDFFISYY